MPVSSTATTVPGDAPVVVAQPVWKPATPRSRLSIGRAVAAAHREQPPLAVGDALWWRRIEIRVVRRRRGLQTALAVCSAPPTPLPAARAATRRVARPPARRAGGRTPPVEPARPVGLSFVGLARDEPQHALPARRIGMHAGAERHRAFVRRRIAQLHDQAACGTGLRARTGNSRPRTPQPGSWTGISCGGLFGARCRRTSRQVHLVRETPRIASMAQQTTVRHASAGGASLTSGYKGHKAIEVCTQGNRIGTWPSSVPSRRMSIRLGPGTAARLQPAITRTISTTLQE